MFSYLRMVLSGFCFAFSWGFFFFGVLNLMVVPMFVLRLPSVTSSLEILGGELVARPTEGSEVAGLREDGEELRNHQKPCKNMQKNLFYPKVPGK